MAASPMRHTAVEDNGNTKNSTAGGREGMGGDEWEGNKGGGKGGVAKGGQTIKAWTKTGKSRNKS